MPSVIDKRIAARVEHKQIETLLLLEAVAARLDLMGSRAERAAVAAIASDDAAGASQELRAVVPRIKATLQQQFNRLAHWSYKQTTAILAAEIPRRWMRLANPIVVYAGEDQQIQIAPGLVADTPTEPIANAGKRMEDQEWVEFCRQYIFPPPSAEKVDQIIHRTVAGQVWTERLDTLSHQIDSFDRLAQTLTTAYSQGASREEIAAQVKPHVRGIASSARRIARTEGLRIATAVQREQYDSLGDMLAGVQIIATLDENTRPHHAARNGTVYWSDRRKRPSIVQLPVLPDEPNCRCFDSPVLKEPAEFKNDPALRAEFANAAGDMIPDPGVYTQWFDRADRGRRMMAVGARRYQSMEKQLAGLRQPQWSDFINGEGKLMGVTALRAETAQQRSARLREVQAAISKRAELLSKINRFGFVPPPPRPAAPPTITGSPFFRGNTKPVSDALSLGGTTAQRAKAKTTLAAIDSVHGDGQLHPIPIQWGKSKKNNGEYHSRGRTPVKIRLSKLGDTPELTLAHEIGHFIDQQGIGSGAWGTSDSKLSALFSDWQRAVQASAAHAEWNRLLAGPSRLQVGQATVKLDKKWLRYILSDKELFARSYAQWIATRSGDSVLLRQLASRQPAASVLHYDHWSDADFRPIAEAMAELFNRLGWLNGDAS